MKNKKIAKVFGWMFVGLLLTFITGYYVASNEYTFYKIFMLYSIVSGLTFSSIFMIYNLTSILVIFLAASLLFGVFACIGYFTKMDLSKLGTYLFMALVALIICIIVNLFVGNNTFELIISYVSVLVFIGFTAYDMQKIKRLCGLTTNENIAVIGALELYLDFINIFISLLDIFGKERD